MTDNDGVKVLSIYCKLHGPMVEDCPEDGEECEGLGKHISLISALDEADAVDGLCQLGFPRYQRKRKFWVDEHRKNCDWKGHAHADKLRGLKDG